MATWTTPTAVHSKCGEMVGLEATRAIDDATNTCWRHDSTCYHWIILDLGQTKTVSKVRLYQSSIASRRWGKTDGLDVFVSDDSANFGSAVWTGALDATGWQESGAFSKNGRYVKLVSKSNSEVQLLCEFDAYTTPPIVPLGGVVSAISTVAGGLKVPKELLGETSSVSTLSATLWLDTEISLSGGITASSSVTGSLEVEIQLLSSTNFGTSNYAGPTGTFIAYGDPTDFMVFITSIADPSADVGETYIWSVNPNSLIVYNSGHGRSEFRWTIPDNPYDEGDLTFAGPGGQTITHTKSDTDYVPCIIPSAIGNGAIGEWWITDIANTSFVVRNSGSGLTGFKWAIPRFGTGGKGASSFAGSGGGGGGGGGVIITHNLNISGDYTPLIIPTEDPNGHLGAVYVTDITTNTFTVKNTGSAITTFMWLIPDTTRGIVADSNVYGLLGRGLPIAGSINSLSTVAGSLSRMRQLVGIIASVSEVTGELCLVAATQGFYYAKLGTDNLNNPQKTSFSITTELNNIASFDYVIQNDAHNRDIIANNLTDDFSIMRDDGTELLRGSIDSDSIEYFTEGEGRGRRRIQLSGFANFVDLIYQIYKRMADADAENVGSVQDEDNSTSTFADYTTEANNATINDVLLTFGAVDDALYIGKDETFFAIKIKYSTKGIQAANTTVVMEYSKGSGVWATLDCIDESYGFTEDAGTYLLYIPNKADDWAKDTINGKNQYHIRFRITQGSYSTLPKLDRIYLSNADICRVQFNDTPADTILGYLLEGTGYTEDATDQCPSTVITIRGEYDSKLRWIYGLGSALTWEDVNGDMQRYDCWIDTSKKVHYKQHRGTDQGDISANFRALRNKLGYVEMGNRIFGAGGQEGINQKRAIVEDLTAQGEHELREIVVEDNRITTYEALKEEALKSLANRKDPLKDVTGDLDTKFWLDHTMDVGDKILVHQPDWNLNNQELYVMRAVIGPSVTMLDLGNSQIHLEHLRSSLQRQMDIDNVWMHGSVSTYISGPVEDNYQRVDDSTVYPVTMKIQVPSNARAINRVEISWTLSNYKSSVKPSSSSAGGHWHTIGDSGYEGGHDHTIGDSGYEGGHYHVTGNSGLEGGHIHAIGDYNYGTKTAAATSENNVVGYLPLSYYVNVPFRQYNASCVDLGSCLTVQPVYSFSLIHNFTTSAHYHGVTIGTHGHSEDTEPDHIHTVPNTNTDPDHAHSVPNSNTEPNHDHTIPNSNTEADHEHTTDYGVHEEAGGTTLELYVNDVLVANTYVGNQSNINITGWISTGSNTVKLQPIVGDNKKGRAEISSINTVFLENLK